MMLNKLLCALLVLVLWTGVAGAALLDNGDGTVTDSESGLMWQQATAPGTYTWAQALTYSEALTLAGHDDWRLPTRTELQSLVAYDHGNPSIDQTRFPDTVSSYYWSSTTYANDTSSAWFVDFGYGGVYSSDKVSSHYVRAVRGGQCRSFDHLTLFAPRQAATLPVGGEQTITWDTLGLGGQVAITLSRDGGASWETIAASAANSGSFPWTVSGPVANNCLVKVAPLAAPEKAASEGLLAIVTLDTLSLIPTVTNKSTSYDLAVEGKFSNGTQQAIDPAVVSWGINDPALATISGHTLTAKKNGIVQVTASYQGLTTSATLPLIDLNTFDAYEGMNNDSQDQANPLAAGEVMQGQVLDGDQDWYALTLAQDAVIDLAYVNGSALAEVLIEVRDGAGALVTSATSQDGAGQVLCVSLAAGTSYIRLAPAGDVDQEASYSLLWTSIVSAPAKVELEPNNTPAQALTLAQNEPVAGVLLTGDSDFSRFTLSQPGLAQLAFISTSGSADTRLTLYKVSEDFPLEDVTSTDGSAATLSLGLAAGDYLVKVAPAGDVDQAAHYTLTLSTGPLAGQEIESNNTPESASSLSPAAPVSGRIYAASDQDLFGFSVASAGLVTITFTPEAGTGASYGIDLLNAAGTVLPGNTKTSANGAVVTFKATMAAGSYFLRVQSGGAVDQFAPYTLAMTAKAQVAGLVKLAGLGLTTATSTLAVGEDAAIALTAFYSDASSGAVASGAAFSSSDPSVLTVDAASGAVHGVKQGQATVTASWQGKAAGLSFTVGTPQTVATQDRGNLIIVAGGTSGDALEPATQALSELAYQKFKARTFTDSDIYYLDHQAVHDLNGDGYDDQIVDDPTPTKDELSTAITGWAKDQASTGPLYLYLVDHGAKGGQFQVAKNEILTGALLKEALDGFQAATNRPVVVIVEACYAGGFVEALANPSYQRLVVSSVDSVNPAYLGATGTPSFSWFFLTGLYKGQSISDSLIQAKADLASSGGGYNSMAPQMGGAEALQGVKVGGDFLLAGLFPTLDGQTASQTISAGSLGLSAQVTSLTGGLTVWAVIVPPDYVPPVVSADFETPVDALPKVTLVDEDPVTKVMDGLFMGSYDGFTKNGAYQVTFYAKDSDNNLTKSAPVTITVTGGEEIVTTTTAAPATTTTTGAPTTTTTLPGGTVSLAVGQGWSLLASTIPFDATTDLPGVTSVWKWVSGQWAVTLPGSDDQGKSYASSKGFQTLTIVNPGEGFWVNSPAAKPVTITGQPQSGALAFGQGWNLVGLKSAVKTTVADLAQGQAGIVSVWKWEDGKWAVNLPGDSKGDTGAAYASGKGFTHLTEINPGEGFWVNKP